VPPVVVKPDAASKYALVKSIGRNARAEPGDRRQRHPCERDQHQTVSSLELALEAPGGKPQQRAENECRQCGNDERRECGSSSHTAIPAAQAWSRRTPS